MRGWSEDVSYKSVKTAHARPRRTWRSGLGLRSTLPEGSRSVASFRKAPAFRHADPGGGGRAGTWLCFLAAKVKRETGRGALGLSTSLQAARTSVSRDEAFSGADRPRAGCARVPSAGSWGAEGSASCPAPRPCLPPGNVFPVTCHVCFCTGQGVWKDAVTRRTRGAAWAAPERPSAGSCSQRPRLQRPSLRDPATGSRPCAPRNGWLWQEQGCHQGHPSRPQSRWPSVHDSGPNGTSSPVEVSGEGCRRNQGTGSVSRGAVTPRGQPWPRAVPEAHGSVLHGGTAQAEGGSWGQSPRGLEFRACVHTRPKA